MPDETDGQMEAEQRAPDEPAPDDDVEVGSLSGSEVHLSDLKAGPLPSVQSRPAGFDNFDMHQSIMSATETSEARSRQLQQARRELSRKTENAIRRQKEAMEAKARLAEKAKYAGYELELQAYSKTRMLVEEEARQNSWHNDYDAYLPGRRAASTASQSGVPESARSNVSARSTRSNVMPFICSSARSDDIRDPEEEEKERLIVERAFQKVKEANEGVDVEKQKLAQAEAEAAEKRYRENQMEYKRKQQQQRLEARLQREEVAKQVKKEAEERREQEIASARELRRTAASRLKLQAQQAQEEEAARVLEHKRKLATQARVMEAHLRKRAEADRKAREIQKEVEEEREQAKRETAEYEAAKQRRIDIFNAEQRRAKKEAWELAAKMEAEEKARREAEVKARFKAAEAERVEREAQKRAEEKRIARKVRAAQRAKLEEEQRAKKAKMREEARALKQALLEAQQAAYEIDAKGKMQKKADPAKELQKKMKKLQEENERNAKARDEEIAANERAYERKMKEEAFQRAQAVAKSQAEVAAIFKKNQEKELADRLERERVEKERNKRIAKEMREKIELENQRQLQMEREAAQNLEEMKVAQYEANLAAHKRRERMLALKARQERGLQETVWMDVMAWGAQSREAERRAKEESKRLFNEQRAMKNAETVELREARLHAEQKMKLELAEREAERAAEEAAEVERKLREKAEKAMELAAEVKIMREDTQAVHEQVIAVSGRPRGASKSGLGFGRIFGSRSTPKTIPEEVRV